MKSHAKEKEMEEDKMVCEEDLQTAEKRSKKQEIKGKIYPTECRVPDHRRSNKKAFFNEQCKELEEDNRMGKISDLFKKSGDTMGIFLSRMGMINDRSGKNLTEAEEIKEGWQEHTEELYKRPS